MPSINPDLIKNFIGTAECDLVNAENRTADFKQRISTLEEQLNSLKCALIAEKNELQNELRETRKVCEQIKSALCISRTISYNKAADFKCNMPKVEKTCNMELNHIKRHHIIQSMTELQLITSNGNYKGQGDVSFLKENTKNSSISNSVEEKCSNTTLHSIPTEIMELDQEITELEKKNSEIIYETNNQ